MHLQNLRLHRFDGSVLKENGLGQLQLEQTRRDSVPAGDFFERTQAVGLFEMPPGEVYRNRERLKPAVNPPPQGQADLFEYIEVELADFLVFLKEGDEVGGVDHSPLGVVPADQRLGAGDPIAVKQHLRLQKHMKIPAFEGIRKQVVELVLAKQPLCEGGIVKSRSLRAMGKAAAGAFCPVLNDGDVQRRLIDDINPLRKAEAGAFSPLRTVDLVRNLLKPACNGCRFVFAQAEEKVIRVGPGGRLIAGDAPRKGLHHSPQGVIPLGRAISFVDQLKVQNIEKRHRAGAGRSALQQLPAAEPERRVVHFSREKILKSEPLKLAVIGAGGAEKDKQDEREKQDHPGGDQEGPGNIALHFL